jgi:hypothetical protein
MRCKMIEGLITWRGNDTVSGGGWNKYDICSESGHLLDSAPRRIYERAMARPHPSDPSGFWVTHNFPAQLLHSYVSPACFRGNSFLHFLVHPNDEEFHNVAILLTIKPSWNVSVCPVWLHTPTDVSWCQEKNIWREKMRGQPQPLRCDKVQ